MRLYSFLKEKPSKKYKYSIDETVYFDKKYAAGYDEPIRLAEKKEGKIVGRHHLVDCKDCVRNIYSVYTSVDRMRRLVYESDINLGDNV